MRRRRLIKSGRCYEICFRAREGLPLVAYRVIKLVIASALARTQRDNKVELCHDIYNGSHAHQLIVAYDAEQCTRFYSEVQKRITDILKRLLGLSYLQIWEGRPMVCEIMDLSKAQDRIAYFYANPAQDDLEDRIELFPGYSGWRDYCKCQESLEALTRENTPWIRLPSVPRLVSPILSPEEDARAVRFLKKRNRTLHSLTRRPNAWMKCFGVVTDLEVQAINRNIVANLRQREERARASRKLANKSVMGNAKLRSQPILKPHIPRKRDRKIFVFATEQETRKKAIAEHDVFCAECRFCYEQWLKGDFSVVWPPGAFKPPLPPNANYLPA